MLLIEMTGEWIMECILHTQNVYDTLLVRYEILKFFNIASILLK